MDIKTLLHNLREEVSCSVCSGVFTDPKQLPCLHSFCLHCLKQWHRTSYDGRGTIRCPNCQAVSRIPESGDLKDLPTSFYLNGLIDVLAIKECKSSQVRCGNCDRKSSETSYCFQWCLFYCQECGTAHNIIKSNNDHRVLALKDFQDKDYEDVLKRPAFCSKQGHTKEELKFFCKNCETAVCQTCVLLEHGGHTLNLIEEEAETQKIQMKSLVETQRQNLQAKMNEVRRLDEDYAKLLQQGEDVKNDIQRIVDNLITALQAKKQNIFSAVENQTMKSLESLTKRKTKIEEQITVIETSLEKADKLLTRSTNAEVVQLKKSLETILEEVYQTDPEGLPVRLAFVENQRLLNTVNIEEIGSLEIQNRTVASQSVAEGKGLEEGTVGGEAQIVLTTRNAEGRQCYNKHDRVTVEIRDEQGRECATEVEINDNKEGSYKISYSLRDQGRYKVTVKVNEQHIRDSPFTVQIKPFQVRPVFSFGKGGSSVGMFKYPWGVAVNDRDEIAVTDSSNHSIQIFNSNGNYLRSFGRQDSDGNIIVVDADNKLIKIFSPNGKFVMKIGGQGSFTFPIHCIQCDRYLIVADRDEHCIKVFDRNGNFKYKFGKQGGGDGEFNEPRGLSVNKSGHLMVCDSGNNRIQVFELNGKFVGKFGTNGSNLGEFNIPRSVAVLSNGRIVVSDSKNTRLQIFE
ncbi:hypothetical protein ACROYT_G034920 [Oculina patagonica]